MKLDMFLNQWKNKSLRDALINQVVTNKHIPINGKIKYINHVVNKSYYDRGEFHLDSIRMYIFTGLALVELYTNIEIGANDKDQIECFDLLSSQGVLNAIMEVIDEDEWNEFRLMLDMATRDVLYNELRYIDNN